MPLPKKLPRSASKAKKKTRAKTVMHELKHAPVTSPARKATSGEQRRKQDIAIMLENTGQSNKAPRKRAK